MNLQAIEMPRAEARAAFQDYRRAVRARHDREDEQIMRGYKALAQGKRVINLRETIQAGGEDAQHRPRLAVVRADATVCFLMRRGDGRVTFGVTRDAARSWRARRNKRVEYEAGTLPAIPGANPWDSVEAEAIAPNVPPRLRPRWALSGYHILFEAQWKRTAPIDPALLKHLGGDLWAVLAVWDLTPLERAVLGARARG
jgi:hypothetical protein